MPRKTNLPPLHRETKENPVAPGHYLAVAYRRPDNRRDLDLGWALGFCYFRVSVRNQTPATLRATARRALRQQPGLNRRDFIVRFCPLTARDLDMVPIPQQEKEAIL